MRLCMDQLSLGDLGGNTLFSQLTCGSHPCLSLGRLRSVMLQCLLYFLVTSSMALGGCASPRTAASNTQVVAPTSTSTPAPVQISITVQQQGQVATHTLKLITTTTVINHTSETIGLLRNYVVPYPFTIRYMITSVNGTKLWDNMDAASP